MNSRKRTLRSAAKSQSADGDGYHKEKKQKSSDKLPKELTQWLPTPETDPPEDEHRQLVLKMPDSWKRIEDRGFRLFVRLCDDKAVGVCLRDDSLIDEPLEDVASAPGYVILQVLHKAWSRREAKYRKAMERKYTEYKELEDPIFPEISGEAQHIIASIEKDCRSLEVVISTANDSEQAPRNSNASKASFVGELQAQPTTSKNGTGTHFAGSMLPSLNTPVKSSILLPSVVFSGVHKHPFTILKEFADKNRRFGMLKCEFSPVDGLYPRFRAEVTFGGQHFWSGVHGSKDAAKSEAAQFALDAIPRLRGRMQIGSP